MEIHKAQIGVSQVTYSCFGEGPAVVLLHGLSGSSRWWMRNTPALGQYFRVYAVDLTGFGNSRGQRFTLNEAPVTILHWMKSLGEDRFRIVGHSMGGYIAASIALQFPEMVEKLVLVDALALQYNRSVFRSAWALVETLPNMPLDFYPVLAFDALRAGPVTLMRAIWDIHHHLDGLKIKDIRVPSLIVWGNHDRIIPLQYGQKLHKEMPDAVFALIPGAGHIPMWDCAEEFNRIVLDFLDQRPVPPNVIWPEQVN